MWSAPDVAPMHLIHSSIQPDVPQNHCLLYPKHVLAGTHVHWYTLFNKHMCMTMHMF